MTDKYAVFQNGGKQYRVNVGQNVKLELIESPTGDKINFDSVLIVGGDGECAVGSPLIKGASVEAEIVDHGRADKISIIQFKRRKHYMRRAGHRQHYTEVKIVGINN